MPTPNYIGRFAPSPSGALHLGSLVAALASYLDAKANHGSWLVRIDDIDTFRTDKETANHILFTLEKHHLFWDKEVVYQSRRLSLYKEALASIEHLIYPCSCTRQRIKALGGIYDGHCLHTPIPDNATYALRVRCDKTNTAEYFDDLIMGPQYFPLAALGDFIVQRKDSIYAYQLVTVVDDIEQKVTHIIRGQDLLDSTSRQRYLFEQLNQPTPLFGHVPLVTDERGYKLCKQHKSPPLNPNSIFENLCDALHFLQLTVPKHLINNKNISHLLTWAIEVWPLQLASTAREE